MSYRVRTLIGGVLGLVLVTGLGAYAYFGVYLSGKRAARDDVLGRMALELEPAAVRRIELETPEERAVLERVGAGLAEDTAWRLVEPLEAEADGIEVESLLSAVRLLSWDRRIPADQVGGQEDRYGFDRPRARWSFGLADGRRLGLSLGKTNTLGQLVYLRLEGSEDVLTTGALAERVLVRSVFDLRQKELLRFEPAQVERLRLEGGESPVTFERRAGRWMLTAPLEDRADGRAVEAALASLRGLRAMAFPSPGLDPRSLGLDEPLARAWLQAAGGEARFEVWLGSGRLPSNQDRMFARRIEPPGPAIQVGTHVLTPLRRKLFEWRDRRLVEFDPAAVARVRVSSEGRLVLLERRRLEALNGEPAGTTWELLSPVAGPARKLRVEAVLQALVELEARRFLAPGSQEEHGLLAPVRTLALLDDQGRELATLRVGRGTSQGVAVQGSARPEPCLVAPEALEALALEADNLRDDGRSGE